MGIHDFYNSFVRKKYVKATADQSISGKNATRAVFGLYLDINGLLYRCKFITYGGDGKDLEPELIELFKDNGLQIDSSMKQRALKAAHQSEKELLETYEKVFSTILISIINAYSPLYELGLYVDGLVPAAKNQQQRRRREKSAMDRAKNLKFNIFDGSQISPGTPFMFWLDEMIKRWIDRNINKNFVPATIIYSNHLVPGEGEHKIMDHFRNIYTEQEKEGKEGKGTHNERTYIVYGLDSDLVLLTAMQNLEGIILVRESNNDVLDINTFKEELIIDLKTEWAPRDFCVMMNFLGNDFLPDKLGVIKVNELDIFFEIYKSLVKKDPEFKLSTEKGHLVWENLEKFLAQLNGYEKLKKYRDMSKKDHNTQSLIFQSIIDVNKEKKFSFDIYRKKWYEHVFKSKGDPSLAEKYMFHGDIIEDKKGKLTVEEDISSMCYDYLEGVEWILRYYLKGHHHVSQTWYYPHYYPPLFSDMYEYVKNNDEVKFNVRYKDIGGYTVLHQLFAILPKSSTELALPKQLLPLIRGTANNIKYIDMFPDVVETDDQGIFINTKAGSFKKHQVIVLAPFIERRRVQEAIASVIKDFTYSELMIYVEQKEKLYRTKAQAKIEKKIKKLEEKIKVKEKREEKKEDKKKWDKDNDVQSNKIPYKKQTKKEYKGGKHIFEVFRFNEAEALM